MTSPVPETLTQLLRLRGKASADRRAYIFLDDDGRESALTYGELFARARAVAAALQSEGLTGERALLLFPPGLEFIVAFAGCVLAGVVAVPAYPPDLARLERTIPRLAAIAADADVSCVLSTRVIGAVAKSLAGHAPELAATQWMATDDIPSSDGERWRDPASRPDDIAFLQYTSGSTASPRGVMVSHRNTLHNSAAIHRLAEHTERSVYVCWLPSYHDMGLIGGLLQPLYGRLLGVLMSPAAFLQRPVRWLQALTRFEASTTPFPNFALDLCVRRVSSEERRELDLSKLRVACNGAEPVRWDSLIRFAEAFAACGFSAEAHYPAYGLAEATLLVTGRSPGTLARALRVDTAELAQGRVRPLALLSLANFQDHADGDSPGSLLVGCGSSLPDQELLVVDPESRRELETGWVGELWLRGPSVALGYFRRAEETAETFGAHLADGRGPYLRTGDLGFLHDGELYITGRSKDLIILRGRNLYPQDVERTAEHCHPQIRPGGVAAFALAVDGEERLALAAEVDTRRGPVDGDAICAALLDAVAREHDAALVTAALLSPGALPKTSSGKVQRRACRDALRSGELTVLHRFSMDKAPIGGPPAPTAPCPPPPDAVRTAELFASTESVDESGPLYDALRARLSQLDRRSTRYQYDLERDIPWARLREPGVHAGPALLGSEHIDLSALREHPAAFDTLQWMIAATVCDRFIVLEEALLLFTAAERGALGATHSIDLLDAEERKHVLMFQRYREHLHRLRPELAADANRYAALCAERLAALPGRLSSQAERHYETWLLLVFFEEYTVFMYRELLRDAGTVQPVWLAVHRAHAREEAQHILTDVAYLGALRVTEEERYAWSRRLFETLVSEFSVLFSLLGEHTIGPCERLHPEVRGQLTARNQAGFVLQTLLGDKAFAQTRAAAPYFARIAARAPVPARHSRAPSEAGLQARKWMSEWLSRQTGLEAAALDPQRTFQSYGLDSVRLIALTGDLAHFCARRLSPTAAYDYPTIELLAEHAATAPSLVAEARPRRPGPLPLGARQKRLVALDRAHPRQVQDHLTEVFALDPVDDEALATALTSLLDRHEALRCRVGETPLGPMQYAAARLEPLPLRRVLSQSHEATAFDDEVRALALEQDRAPFELDRPLLRATLVLGPNRVGALVFTVHHLACDGWSLAVLGRELSRLYRGALAKQVPELPSLEKQQADVAARETAFLRGSEARAREAFWRERLSDHPRLSAPPPTQPFRSAVRRRPLPQALFDRLSELAHRLGVTPYIALLTVFHAVLQQRSSEPDILVNTHIFNRSDADERALVGYLVDVLTLRPELPRGLSFAESVRRIHAAWMEALDHSLPIDEIVRTLRPDAYAERYMPATSAFNMLFFPHSEEPREAMTTLCPRPDLAPSPGFLFFQRMVLLAPDPSGQPWLTVWFDEGAVPAQDAENLLEEFLAYVQAVVDVPQGVSLSGTAHDRAALIRASGRQFLAARLGVPSEALTDDIPLTRLGLDSIVAAELAATLERAYGIAVDAAQVSRHRTLGTLAMALAVAPTTAARGVAAKPGPLSFGELGLFRLLTREPSFQAPYNLLTKLHIAAPPDGGRLRGALALLMARHEALRTGFHAAADGTPQRQVLEDVTPPLVVRTVAPDQAAAAVRAEVAALWDKRFDLASPPLFAAVLVDTGAEGTLLLSYNHLIVDAWSIATLHRELVASWRALISGETPRLPALLLTPSGHAQALNQQFAPLLARGRQAYPPLRKDFYRLPLDAAMPENPRPQGAVLGRIIDAGLWARVRAASMAAEQPPATALIAAFQYALHRHAQRPDVAFTVVRSGRNSRSLQNVVGYLSYGETFEGTIAPGESWAALLSRATPVVLDQRTEQMPYNVIVQPPSMRVVFNLHNYSAVQADIAPFHYVQESRPPYLWPVWDLFFQISPQTEALAVDILFRDEVLRRETVEGLCSYFEEALLSMTTPYGAPSFDEVSSGGARA